MQVPVDHIFDGANLVKLSLEVISETLLVSELTGNVTLLVSCLLQLRKHKVKSLHQALFILFEHYDLVFVLLVGLCKLSIILQIRPVILNRLEATTEIRGLVVQIMYATLI